MSMKLGDHLTIKDNPNIAALDAITGSDDQPTVASLRTGITSAFAQEADIRVPNLVTRQTFASTDNGIGLRYFDSVDDLMKSLDD